MSERDELAKDIFISDNSSNPNAETEWDEYRAIHGGGTFEYGIADGLLAKGWGKLAPLQREIEELQEFQNSIADRMPEHYDGDEAQEHHINRWLDDITRG